MTDPTIFLMILIAFLFGAGIIHEAFWILDAFVCFYAMEAFSVDFPSPSMIPFVFLAFGMILLVVAIARMKVSGGRVR